MHRKLTLFRCDLRTEKYFVQVTGKNSEAMNNKIWIIKRRCNELIKFRVACRSKDN